MFRVLWVVLCVVGGFVQCSSVERPLTLVLSREPEALMFSTYETLATQLVKYALFRGLTERDAHWEVFPELAEYVPSFSNDTVRLREDGTMEVLWQLKENLKWSDAMPLTTEDIRFTYQVLMHPEVQLYSQAREDAKVIQSIQVIDKRRFTVIWKRPYSRYFMSHQIYPKHILHQEFVKNPSTFNKNSWNRKPIGNGPFRLREWRAGEYILLERNPFFHKTVRSNRLAFQFIRNTQSAMIHLINGEADITLVVSPEQRRFLMNQYTNRIATRNVRSMGWIHIDMNLEHPVLKTKKIRHALLYAINRQEILKKVFLDEFEVSNSWLPSKHYAYVPLFESDLYNPHKALEMLQEEGWKKNAQGFLEKDGELLRLKLFADSKNQERVRIAVMVKEYLRRLGIELDLKFHPTSVFISQFLVPQKFDMALYAWYISPDADGQAYWASSSIPGKENGFFGLNFSRLRNQRIDRIHVRLPYVLDTKLRKALLAEHQQVWGEELPALPLFVTNSISAVNKNLRNWEPSGSSVPETWNCESWYLEGSA